MAQLSIRKVSKSFANQPAVEDVNLDVSPHDIVCLLGPSGCGKTTLLRIIAGLENADAGQIRNAVRKCLTVPEEPEEKRKFLQGVTFMFEQIRDQLLHGE